LGTRLWLGWLLSVLSLLSVRGLGLLSVRTLESHEDIKVEANLLSFMASVIRAIGAEASTETSNSPRIYSRPTPAVGYFLGRQRSRAILPWLSWFKLILHTIPPVDLGF